MVSFPPCKINLGLSILRKRDDGFHDIETCFYPVPFTDIVEVIPADKFKFSTSGLAIDGKESDNLCVKAYALLQEVHQLPPVQIHLHKIIPMGAGLGGGSADAAHCIRILNEIFTLQLSEERMREYAARLGSDCAFFISDGPMLGTGRGDVLNPLALSLKGYYLVLANPGIHVSTAAAYAGVVPATPVEPVSEIVSRPVGEWRKRLKNDFEKPVFGAHQELREIKDNFYKAGAAYAAMSGSGSTIFGLFEKKVSDPGVPSNIIIWEGFLA